MSLYGVIADTRREHPTPAASKTLDLLVAELGRTRDNLREAAARLSERALPPGGQAILDEVLQKAAAAGVDDLKLGPAPDEIPEPEPLDEGTAGIGVLLGISSLVVVGLAVVAVVIGIRAIIG